MKNLHTLFLLCCLPLSIVIFAQKKETPPGGSTPKDFILPGKKVKSLPNGLKINTVKYGNVPKATIQLIIKTGNVHEKDNEVWLSDLTVNLMKQGSQSASFKEMADKAAAMGGNISVSTGIEQVYIYGTVLSEFAPAFISMIADMVLHPAFPNTELPRLKNDLKRQLSYQQSVPQNLAMEKFYQAMYAGSPYARYFPTEEMLDSYTVDKIKEFYNNNFGAKRSVLYVAGSFNEAAVNTAAEKAFSKWKPGPDISYPAITAKAKADTVIIERKKAPQTTLIIGQPILTPGSKDYIPFNITNMLLGGAFASRITSNIREDKGYTYSPYSTIKSFIDRTVWYEQADVTSEHSIDAIREIEKEIKKLQTEPPAKNELEGIQNYAAGIFVLQNSSPRGIISQLNFLDRFGLPDSFLTNQVKDIHAVTPEKVTELVKNYLKYENMTFILVGDKTAITEQINSKKAF